MIKMQFSDEETLAAIQREMVPLLEMAVGLGGIC
jgi:hypothetical protein